MLPLSSELDKDQTLNPAKFQHLPLQKHSHPLTIFFFQEPICFQKEQAEYWPTQSVLPDFTWQLLGKQHLKFFLLRTTLKPSALVSHLQMFSGHDPIANWDSASGEPLTPNIGTDKWPLTGLSTLLLMLQTPHRDTTPSFRPTDVEYFGLLQPAAGGLQRAVQCCCCCRLPKAWRQPTDFSRPAR